MWKCPKCGTEGRAGMRICRQCGGILIEFLRSKDPAGE